MQIRGEAHVAMDALDAAEEDFKDALRLWQAAGEGLPVPVHVHVQKDALRLWQAAGEGVPVPVHVRVHVHVHVPISTSTC